MKIALGSSVLGVLITGCLGAPDEVGTAALTPTAKLPGSCQVDESGRSVERRGLVPNARRAIQWQFDRAPDGSIQNARRVRETWKGELGQKQSTTYEYPPNQEIEKVDQNADGSIEVVTTTTFEGGRKTRLETVIRQGFYNQHMIYAWEYDAQGRSVVERSDAEGDGTWSSEYHIAYPSLLRVEKTRDDHLDGTADVTTVYEYENGACTPGELEETCLCRGPGDYCRRLVRETVRYAQSPTDDTDTTIRYDDQGRVAREEERAADGFVARIRECTYQDAPGRHLESCHQSKPERPRAAQAEEEDDDVVTVVVGADETRTTLRDDFGNVLEETVDFDADGSVDDKLVHSFECFAPPASAQ